MSIIEKSVPKPDLTRPESILDYVSTRTLEALYEIIIAFKFLDEGLTRNAAGKIFQAWKSIFMSLLAIKRDEIESRLRDEKEREWFRNVAILRLPTTKMKPLSQIVETIDNVNVYFCTELALDLHDYQYHGPDPDRVLSRYAKREEAVRDMLILASKIVKIVSESIKKFLGNRWTQEHEKALQEVVKSLSRWQSTFST